MISLSQFSPQNFQLLHLTLKILIKMKLLELYMLKINKLTFFFGQLNYPLLNCYILTHYGFNLNEIVNGINFKWNHLPLTILF